MNIEMSTELLQICGVILYTDFVFHTARFDTEGFYVKNCILSIYIERFVSKIVFCRSNCSG
jgi:hypothetical protein